LSIWDILFIPKNVFLLKNNI